MAEEKTSKGRVYKNVNAAVSGGMARMKAHMDKYPEGCDDKQCEYCKKSEETEEDD